MPVHIAQPLRVVHLEAYALGSDQTQPCDLFPSQLLKTRQGDMAFARDFIGQRGVRYRNLPQARLLALHFARDVQIFCQWADPTGGPFSRSGRSLKPQFSN